MVDIETFATHHYAPIISIGAVAFDPYNFTRFEDMQEFYAAIDLTSNVRLGRQMDPDTVLWWLQPDQAAAHAEWRKTLKFELSIAMQGFQEWVYSLGNDKDSVVWSYGSTFDLVILGTAFKQTGIEQPWTYRTERCFRTLRSLAPNAQVPQVGTTHNALDDARYQTRLLFEIKAALNLSTL